MSSIDDYFNRLVDESNAYAKKFGLDPNSVSGGEWDAFRHAYASAEVTREYGRYVAYLLGWAHEVSGDINGQEPPDRNMDLWNNSVGRDIGESSISSQDSASQALEALRQGSLVTDPNNDPRIHNNFEDDHPERYPDEPYPDPYSDPGPIDNDSGWPGMGEWIKEVNTVFNRLYEQYGAGRTFDDFLKILKMYDQYDGSGQSIDDFFEDVQRYEQYGDGEPFKESLNKPPFS